MVEQVAGFKLTEYPPDGRGTIELDFEQKVLVYDRRGGFTLSLVSEDGVLQEELLDMWLARMKSLGGPVLLERGKSMTPKTNGDDENDEEGDPDGPSEASAGSSAKPSFASDRRIIRLIIARVFADWLQEKYLLEHKS